MYSNYRAEPDFAAALGLLEHLSNDELKEMLNDDEEKFSGLMKDVNEFKSLETEKEMLLASNKSLAEFNLGKEPQLEEGKKQIRALSMKGGALCQSVMNKMSQLKSHSGSLSLETALALLKTSAAESEEESDAIASKFLDGELDLDSFLEQFAQRRKQMHLRRVKSDKMTELIRQQSVPVRAVQSPPCPYPVVGNNQPMPGRYGY